MKNEDFVELYNLMKEAETRPMEIWMLIKSSLCNIFCGSQTDSVERSHNYHAKSSIEFCIELLNSDNKYE